MKDMHLVQRITQELKAAGMTNYGFTKLETNYLPKIIHDDEKIKAVVYGLLLGSLDSVMLVATDKRVLFIDCKPLYKNWDEITYEVVAGVKTSVVGPFASVTLHTRVEEYSLRFVNITCAKNFSDYIEKHIEIQNGNSTKTNQETQKISKKTGAETVYQPYRIERAEPITPTIEDTGILSTIDANGDPYASVIHFLYGKDDSYYFLTKAESRKAINIIKNPKVAFTIHTSHSLKVLYIRGSVTLEQDKAVRNSVIDAVASIHEYSEGARFAPIMKLEAGQYVVFKLNAEDSELLDYSSDSW